jgi:hypothetical protein
MVLALETLGQEAMEVFSLLKIEKKSTQEENPKQPITVWNYGV